MSPSPVPIRYDDADAIGDMREVDSPLLLRLRRL